MPRSTRRDKNKPSTPLDNSSVPLENWIVMNHYPPSSSNKQVGIVKRYVRATKVRRKKRLVADKVRDGSHVSEGLGKPLMRRLLPENSGSLAINGSEIHKDQPFERRTGDESADLVKRTREKGTVTFSTRYGPTRFRTEIIWKRTSAHSDTRQGRRQHGRIQTEKSGETRKRGQSPFLHLFYFLARPQRPVTTTSVRDECLIRLAHSQSACATSLLYAR